jgi:ariadne-1
VCGVAAFTAAALLQHFKWNPEVVIENWLEDSERTQKKAGVGTQKTADKKKPEERKGVSKSMIVEVEKGFLQCLICYEVVPEESSFALGCRHLYCNECWVGYLNVAVAEGPGCIETRCMYPDCPELVHDEVCFSFHSQILFRSLKIFTDFQKNGFTRGV